VIARSTRSQRSPSAPGWFTRGVRSVGLASFFSDSGHEIATSLLPSFVSSTLRASAGTLGVIEGISDGLAGIAKLVGGAAANDAVRRRRLATGGYLVTGLATGALGLATTLWQAGALRAVAWIARGSRTPARDTLLASLAPRNAYGRAFGYERTMDHLGAVAGPLAAAALIAGVGIRSAIYFSAIPGFIAAGAIVIAARESRKLGDPTPRRFRLEFDALREAGLLKPLLPVALFELGNMATTLLILRATTLLADGRSATNATALAVLLYAGHNLAGSLMSLPAGHWIDRSGPRRVFAVGVVAFALAYVGFAFSLHSWLALLVLFVLAGAGMGLAETTESAVVARALPDHLRGSGFGLLGGLQSIGDFASSAAVGIIWASVSAGVGFVYAAAWMILATLSAGLIGSRTH
jgi:MFS family permease